MNKQIIRMYLDKGQLERDRRYFLPEPPAYASFIDDERHRTTDLFYEDWLSMGSPKEVVVTVQPADVWEENRKKTDEVIARSREQSKKTQEILARSRAARAKAEPILRRAGLIK